MYSLPQILLLVLNSFLLPVLMMEPYPEVLSPTCMYVCMYIYIYGFQLVSGTVDG